MAVSAAYPKLENEYPANRIDSSPSFWAALRRAEEEQELSLSEVAALLATEQPAEVQALMGVADRIRRRYVGDEVHLRGLIEFSNVCRRNCLYCGLRATNAKVRRYRMPADEIVESAEKAYRLGFRTVVLQSGEDPWYTVDRMCEIVRQIKSRVDVAVTLSIGERPREEYAALKEAGADRYLLRHEAADPCLYASLHPDSVYEERLRCLHWLRELGYQIGAGSMVGLPGQTLEMLAKDVLILRELEVDMAGIGPFIPNPDTPLGTCQRGTVEMTLKMIALARIVTRDALIPATTALASIDPLGREKAFQAGANVVMPNVTPLKYREDYRIYPGKACLKDDAEHCQGCLRLRIASVGRTVGTGYGHSPRYQRLVGQRP